MRSEVVQPGRFFRRLRRSTRALTVTLYRATRDERNKWSAAAAGTGSAGTSSAVRATDSFPRGVTFFGNARMAPPTKEPSPEPIDKFRFFFRLEFQSATRDAVWSSVGTSPVNSSQKTASGLGAFPRRGKSLSTSGMIYAFSKQISTP